MKKLLFIVALAAICTITTSSFDPLGSSNTMVMQTIANTSRTETGTKEQPTKVNKQKTLDIISQCCRSAAVATKNPSVLHEGRPVEGPVCRKNEAGVKNQ